MKISVRLFGALSDYTREPLEFELDAGRRVADLRVALERCLTARGADLPPALLRSSVFADTQRVLHESDPLPDDGQVAVLPPVSGG